MLRHVFGRWFADALHAQIEMRGMDGSWVVTGRSEECGGLLAAGCSRPVPKSGLFTHALPWEVKSGIGALAGVSLRR